MKKYITCVYDTEEDTFDILEVENESIEDEKKDEKITRKGKILLFFGIVLFVSMIYGLMLYFFTMIGNFIREGFQTGFRMISIVFVISLSFVLYKHTLIDIKYSE